MYSEFIKGVPNERKIYMFNKTRFCSRKYKKKSFNHKVEMWELCMEQHIMSTLGLNKNFSIFSNKNVFHLTLTFSARVLTPFTNIEKKIVCKTK